MSEILKYAGSISTIITHIIQNNEKHIEFLDPICTILKLIVLNFKEIGTKISIRDNSVYIQENWILQGCQRYIYGDDRANLYQLRLPILYFKGISNGLIKTTINKKKLEELIPLTISGLTKLRTTYETTKKTGIMIRNCIDEYIKILKTEYTEESYDNEIKNEPKHSSLFSLYNQFTEKWDNKDIDLFIELIKNAEEKNEKNVINKISKSIDELIFSKDAEIGIIRPT